MAAVTPEKVSFRLARSPARGPSLPAAGGAAVIICHPPWTSIKEQSPASYARVLSRAGFVCLAFDAARIGTDVRIRAVATSAAVCVGTTARRGFDKDSAAMDELRAQLEAAARDRNGDMTGKDEPAVHLLPERLEDLPAAAPESSRDLASYYRTPKGHHERATNTCIPRSWDIMANFDAFAHNDMISPRPLLMIPGSRAATKWYSEDDVAKATEPKELGY